VETLTSSKENPQDAEMGEKRNADCGAQKAKYVQAMSFLRKLHLYLGCLFAPTLIFFAVSGSWQLFNWHESTRDHTYTAPRALAVLSDIHKDAHIPPTPNRKPTPLRYFLFTAAVGLVTTTILGVIMAYRFSQRPIVATVSLLLGIVVPATLIWIYR
jgi:hypothetical protein